MSTFIEFSLLGLFSGGLYALIALSFVLIYKCTHVINFAVGEIMMLGAYLYYTSNVMLGLPPALAIVVTLAAPSACCHSSSSTSCFGRSRASRSCRC